MENTLSIILLFVTFRYSEMIYKDACLGETFSPQCGPCELIRIDRALYGRMQLSRCVQNNLGYIGCSADVTLLVNNGCGGKDACTLAVTDLPDNSDCPRAVTKYLEVHYECEPDPSCIGTTQETQTEETETEVVVETDDTIRPSSYVFSNHGDAVVVHCDCGK